MQATLTTPPDSVTPVVTSEGIELVQHSIKSTTAQAASSAEPRAEDSPQGQALPPLTQSSAPIPSDRGMADYQRLQRRLLGATAAATVLAVCASALLFNAATALSVLVGGLSGLLYLLLLARSVSRLGGDRRSLGKAQLLVPVALVLASSRIPGLAILPALLGFLLYKPALILQVLLDR